MKNNSTKDHNMHHDTAGSSRIEYAKFAGILLFILVDSLFVMRIGNLTFLDAFMGVFFTVFSLFKLYSLKEFAAGFSSYDLIAKKSYFYGKLYPFIQLILGIVYLIGYGTREVDVFVIVLSLISAAGVINSLLKKQQVHCVCLGSVIKLPLSRISFVEDFGMAIMAAIMLITR